MHSNSNSFKSPQNSCKITVLGKIQENYITWHGNRAATLQVALLHWLFEPAACEAGDMQEIL